MGLLSFLTTVLAWIIVCVKRRFKVHSRLFYKVDTTSPNHGGQLVAKVLKSHGVKYIFTLCGGHISPILVASEQEGIRVVDVRHEATAVFAADAVARLSGVIGVAAVTAGPGLTNTVTAVKNAQMAESPVLVIGGAVAILSKGRGALQDIDQLSLFAPICKYCVSVKSARDIVPTLKEAIKIAQSGTPGPVFVEFPIDTLYPYDAVQREVMPGYGKLPQTLYQKITAFFVESHMYDLFGNAWDDYDIQPLPVDQVFVSPSQLGKCARLLLESKRPVIILGSQATLPPTPAEELRAALEQLGVPCFLGGMARGMLGRDGACHVRQRRTEALKEADLVILAGAVCDFRLKYGSSLNRKSKIIAVNRCREQLLKNSDFFWTPTIALEADPGNFLHELSRELKNKYVCDAEWLAKLKNRDAEKESSNREKANVDPPSHLNPLKVLQCLEDAVEDNSILVVDGGDFVGSAAYIVRPRSPLSWLDPGAFGTLGVGGGFALGAKLCRPEAEVWIIYGDGSLGYSVAEFDTFTRHQTPVLALVGNDACWSQIARAQVPMFKSSVACDLAYCEYEKVAEGYGGHGLILDATATPEAKDIDRVLKEAKALARKGKPVLINAFIGKSDFREGSISV